MSVSQVEVVTGKSLAALGARAPRGTHYLERGRTTMWFDFDTSGLRSILVSQLVNLMKGDSTQRDNLCTGAVTTLVLLYLPDNLAGATVFVDSEPPQPSRRGQTAYFIDLPPGWHEIRIQKGGRTAVRRVEVILGGPGEVRLYVEDSEVAGVSEMGMPRVHGAT